MHVFSRQKHDNALQLRKLMIGSKFWWVRLYFTSKHNRLRSALLYFHCSTVS